MPSYLISENRYCGESFWLAHDATPRCTLERIARQIYLAHTKDVTGINAEISGAEWWCQLRKHGDEEKETIGFHWDKDEDMLDEAGINIFPHLYVCVPITSIFIWNSKPNNGVTA